MTMDDADTAPVSTKEEADAWCTILEAAKAFPVDDVGAQATSGMIAALAVYRHHELSLRAKRNADEG